MSASEPSGLIQRARSYPTLGALLFGGIGGVILAFFEQVIRFMLAIVDFFLVPLTTFTGQLGNIIIAFVGGAARIITQGAVTSVESIAPTGAFALGPFTFAEGIGAAALGLFAMVIVLSLAPTSDLIPFSFTDFPLLGVDEDDEDLFNEN